MSNSDLLIAQLQRRNRIMFGSMLGGFAVIAIGLGVLLLDAASQAPAPTDAQTPPAHTCATKKAKMSGWTAGLDATQHFPQICIGTGQATDKSSGRKEKKEFIPLRMIKF